MAYDADKDCKLLTRFVEADRGKIMITICSYDDGELKIQLSRKFETRFNKLGRMTFDEAGRLADALRDIVFDYRGKSADELKRIAKEEGD